MKKRLNILFIHEVNYLAKPIFEMHEFPELLAKRGHNVSFIQFNEGYKLWNQKRAPRSRVISGRVHSESKIELLTPFQLGIPGFDRLFAVLTFIPLLIWLLRRSKFDVIVQLAVPTYGIQTNLIAHARGIPVVFRALDVSHKIRKSLLSGLIKASERFVYKGATLISANNPAMGEYCMKLGSRDSKSLVNVPPLDIQHFQSMCPQEALTKSLGIEKNDIVITYMGSFFYFSGLTETIESFAKVSTENVKLLIIGGGEQDSELRHLTRKLGLENKVIFTGYIDYQELPKYFSLSTVAINPMVPGLVSNTAFPHKVLQYIAADLPVVSTKLDGLFRTFGQASGITWVDASSDIMETALQIASDSKTIKRNIEAQKTIATRIFGIEKALDDIESSFHEAIRLKQ